jgi:hypothetical protein
MDFPDKKPTKEMLNQLYRVQIDTIRPYSIMIAPAYLYIAADEKFIPVKSKYDFFMANELERMKYYKYFFYDDSITASLPFRDAGRRARKILATLYERVLRHDQTPYPESNLPSPEFEIFDEMVKILGPLWKSHPENGMEIDPGQIVIFISEVCDLFPSDKISYAREKNMSGFLLALQRSSWAVFLALHLGYCELEFLNNLRIRVFDENVKGDLTPKKETEIDEVISLANSSIKDIHRHSVFSSFFRNRLGRVSQKIESRLDQIRAQRAYSTSPEENRSVSRPHV